MIQLLKWKVGPHKTKFNDVFLPVSSHKCPLWRFFPIIFFLKDNCQIPFMSLPLSICIVTFDLSLKKVGGLRKLKWCRLLKCMLLFFVNVANDIINVFSVQLLLSFFSSNIYVTSKIF